MDKSINPMNGSKQTTRQIEWRFGPNWPGKRCGAKTRNGSKCQKPALKGKSRCHLHGGRAGAPSGERNGAYKHGRYSTEAVATQGQVTARLRALELLGRSVGMFK